MRDLALMQEELRQLKAYRAIKCPGQYPPEGGRYTPELNGRIHQLESLIKIELREREQSK